MRCVAARRVTAPTCPDTPPEAPVWPDGTDRAEVAAHGGGGLRTIADAVLADLLPTDGVTDDTALVIVRL